MREIDKEIYDDFIELLESRDSLFMAWFKQIQRKFGRYIKAKKSLIK